ncbi:PEPxxWA-CTERM sorting domain-containing protein [Sphingomonas sp. AP4-R1]|uniref:PQQ-dependent sugar dehydrogenase n=1 Tax=Sphingomonas sp. AP4-R1 TaxID=2735134 RepID=UPI001493305E|nr:PQQ-dependent sugar dehydrogenase [Sphingomonas sp. AP4-R1]QJU58914.1 PEPxxWA-CTERM sorting domain-containing protein [Sphingomonas sp. AP4-R1]
MKSYRILAMMGALAASTAHAAVVTNPVPAPIAQGITVGLSLFGQAQVSGDPVIDGFTRRIQQLQPVADTSGRLFVNDTRGTISIVGAAGGAPQTWFDIRGTLADFSTATNPSQTGLMSFALHPNFAGDPQKPGYGVFYTIATTRPSGTETYKGNGQSVDHDNVVTEFRVDDPTAATASIASQREVLRVAQPFSDHGAGTIAFNPTATPDSAEYGKLYIGLGDGGGVGDPYGNAQDPGSPFGKILRIDPAAGLNGEAYTIPADNPHVGQSGVLGEVWASGLRNPQQFSWDSKTGQMLIADIGQSQLEEVNIGVAGGNYGWPIREGTFARGVSWDPNVYDMPANSGAFLDPVAQFDHEEIFRSGAYFLAAISGAYAYTGTAVPELTGMVVLAELVSGRLFYYDPLSVAGATPATLYELGLVINGVPSTLAATDGNVGVYNRVDLRLGTDNAGELYLIAKNSGDIYRLASLLALPEPANWMLMLAGFGLIGAALRRRPLSHARPVRA